MTSQILRTSKVDMKCRLGSLALPNPVMTASGTSGHGNELDAFFNLSDLGAVVVKSLAHFEWKGNLPLRVTPCSGGMLNSVGLAGPGIDVWIDQYLPALVQSGARVVASIWGRSVSDYVRAAEKLVQNKYAVENIIAVELNVSCPNLEDSRYMFSHSAATTGKVVSEFKNACNVPIWTKLSPNVPNIIDIASAALEAGSESLTLVNTLIGMAIDIESRKPKLGGITGGLSGPALHPVALRCVYECRREFPEAAIVGVGGISGVESALEMIMAGANAIQVGTATFVDPKAPMKVLVELQSWCNENGVEKITDLVGVSHN